AGDVGLEQHIDGVPLEGEGEPGPGQGPGDMDPPDAVGGAIDPGDLRVQMREAVAVIEVPPTPRGGVVVEGGPAAALRARERGVAPMDEPDVDGALLGVEGDPLDRPGLPRGQESCPEGDVAHGRAPRAGDESGTPGDLGALCGGNREE